MKRLIAASAIVLASALGLSGGASAKGERYVLIEHSPDTETFWNTVKNAAQLAAAEVGATVDFRNPPTGDMADMVRIIDQAAASKVDGIIVTIPDFSLVSGPISRAVDRGIPVVTMNTGTAEVARSLARSSTSASRNSTPARALVNVPRLRALSRSSVRRTVSSQMWRASRGAKGSLKAWGCRLATR